MVCRVIKLAAVLFCLGISCYEESAQCSDRYPKCKGERQSPIDIRDEDLTPKRFEPIAFGNYNSTALRIRVTNYGVMVLAVFDVIGGRAYISGAGLSDDKYELSQFHFHWGSDSSRGSEHTYHGKPYPAELHFIHYNCVYSDMHDAVTREPDGIAALVVFIEVAETDNPAYDDIINAITRVRKPGQKQVLKPSRLDTLLPSNTEDFYRYHGSLSTPDFHESVQWILLKTPVKLSEAQINEFRKMSNTKGETGLNPYRPTQPLHGRTVYYTGGRPQTRTFHEGL